MSEQGYKVLLEKAAKVRKWGDNQTCRERFRKVISKSISPAKLSLSLPETYSDVSEVQVAIVTNFFFHPEKPATIPKRNRLHAAYWLLTILHDKIYEYESWVTPISVDIWSLDAEWIEALWEQMKKSSKAVASGDAEFFDKIDFALKLVEADLPEKPAETERNRKATIAAIIISLIMILLFVLPVYLIPLTWLKNHPKSYHLQSSVICLIICVVFGFLKPQWRKWCWGSAVAFGVLILSLA